jgi:hypothetical protein
MARSCRGRNFQLRPRERRADDRRGHLGTQGPDRRTAPPHRWSFDACAEPSSQFEVNGRALRERFAGVAILRYEVMKRFTPLIARRLASARERLVECLMEPS